jgi:hypothetical protein
VARREQVRGTKGLASKVPLTGPRQGVTEHLLDQSLRTGAGESQLETTTERVTDRCDPVEAELVESRDQVGQRRLRRPRSRYVVEARYHDPDPPTVRKVLGALAIQPRRQPKAVEEEHRRSLAHVEDHHRLGAHRPKRLESMISNRRVTMGRALERFSHGETACW